MGSSMKRSSVAVVAIVALIVVALFVWPALAREREDGPDGPDRERARSADVLADALAGSFEVVPCAEPEPDSVCVKISVDDTGSVPGATESETEPALELPSESVTELVP